jgi:hypothetical protein
METLYIHKVPKPLRASQNMRARAPSLLIADLFSVYFVIKMQ